MFREVLAIRPDKLRACWKLGMSLLFSGRNEEAIVVLGQFLEQLSPNGPLASRTLIVVGLACKSIACSRLGRLEAAAEDLEQVSEYIGPEAPADELRSYAAVAYVHYGHALQDSDRLEESIAAFRRVTEQVSPDDSSEMRQFRRSGTHDQGQNSVQIGAPGRCNRCLGSSYRVCAHGGSGRTPQCSRPRTGQHLLRDVPGGNRRRCDSGQLQRLKCRRGIDGRVCQPDDPAKLRDYVIGHLSDIGRLRNVFGDFGRAEAACKKATNIDPSHAKSWRVLAEAILRQGDDARLSEAEDYARRAVGLAPGNPIASRTLSDVLACLGKWTEALDWLERSLLVSWRGIVAIESARTHRTIDPRRCRRPRKARQEDDGRGKSGRNPWSRSGTQYGLNWAKSSNPCPRKSWIP